MNKVENIVKYSEIGDVRYVQNRRAKNLSIRINQQGEVRVTIPRYVSKRRAEVFLLSKMSWISAKLIEINKMSDSRLVFREGDVLKVRGKSIPISLQKGEEAVEEAIWRILREEAHSYLPGRVNELAAIHGFKITGLKIRKMKTRWGSCTRANSINLNSWLMMLPDYLSDYVILHELVHTKHRDHSQKFWDALDGVTCGSSKKLRKELRSQRIMSVNSEK